MGIRGLKQLGHEGDHSPPSNEEKNAYKFTFFHETKQNM
jgi:hypothetical protein